MSVAQQWCIEQVGYLKTAKCKTWNVIFAEENVTYNE